MTLKNIEQPSFEQGKEKDKSNYEKLLECGRPITLDFEPRFIKDVDKNNCCSYMGHYKFGIAKSLLIIDKGKASIIDLYSETGQFNPKLQRLTNNSPRMLEEIIKIITKERGSMEMSEVLKEDQEKIYKHIS